MDSKTTIILAVGCLVVGTVILTRIFGRVSSAKAKAMLKGGAKLLDVRSPEEFRSGHVKGAVNVPYQEVGQRIAGIEPDKTAPILVYCLSGGRSGIAKSVLQRQGYVQVRNLGSLARAKRIVES